MFSWYCTGRFDLHSGMWGRGGGTPILEGGRELPRDWPLLFCIFRSHRVPFYDQLNLIDPFFCRFFFNLSITFSSEIILPKVGQMFYQNLIWPFWSIWHHCSLWFLILLTPFSLFLDLFDPSFYQTLDPNGTILSSRAGLLFGPVLRNYKRQLLHMFSAYQPDMGPVHCGVILTLGVETTMTFTLKIFLGPIHVLKNYKQ